MADFSKDYTIKKLEADEFHLITPLMKNCFGMEVNIDYFKWKFINNPSGHYVGFVAVHKESGEIGAYYGVIPETYRIDGQERVIFQSCDTMTHSGHRRRGLFQLLALHCYEHLRQQGKLFVIGYGGALSTPGLEKFGWRHVVPFVNYFIPGQLAWLNTGFLTPGDAIVEIQDVREIAHLLEKGSDRAIQSVRTPEIVQWRYSNPRTRYEVQAYRKNGQYEGYACFYTENNKIFLFDFHFANSRARSALTNYLKRRVARNGHKGLVAFVAEGSRNARILARSGFLRNPFKKGPLHEKSFFMFFAPNEVMDRYQPESNWYIEGFDHDSL